MSEHFSDMLLNAIDAKGSPVCVGIDPVIERLPRDLRQQIENDPWVNKLEAIYEFCSIVIDAIADHVPAVKFQSACFERYRSEGVEDLYELITEAREHGLIVILDAKRGDIGLSSEHYADGCYTPEILDDSLVHSVSNCSPHAVTVNSYLGIGAIEPFCRDGRGAFALVRTSNPESDEIQSQILQKGITVAEHVAECVNSAAQLHLGVRGYSDLGAVVGATKTSEIMNLREIMPNSIFLVPGYGAQGGTAKDIAPCFNKDGYGALITASRSVLYAYDQKSTGLDWIDNIVKAAQLFSNDVKSVISG